MEPGVVGARLASSAVMPLVKKLFVKEGPGAGLAEKPVRISSLLSFTGEKRTLSEKELHRLVRELVKRAAEGTGADAEPVESEAVTDALVRTLHALGDLRMDDVEAVALGEQALKRALLEAAGHAGPAPASALSSASEALYERVLDSACLHILHFFTQRSTFVARTLVEQSRQLSELVARSDLLLSRLASRTSEDAAFEKRYAAYVAKKHSSITIYGIDLKHSSEWPLDTAYLNLEVTQRSAPGPWAGADDAHDGWRPVSRRVDEALAGHKRVLLRGVAGSGKTTLMQWLAVSTAGDDGQDRLTGELTRLTGMVPFVLPLRTLARGGAELPAPEGFLGAVGCPLAGNQPHGWASRVLTAERGLILVDGIDEVPEDDRERTRRWLRDLLTAFPGNRLLVTSRPSAVSEDWLSGDKFAELSLSAMRPADVAVFVRRWHKAAAVEGELEEALLGELRVKPDLARLATNPLMCGLICALHRERRGFLPRGRKALYDAALSMMLERRDRERHLGSLSPGGIDLDGESQTELLQKLAYWLIRNGRAEMERSDAVGLLERVLPSMPYAQAQGSPEDILRFLLVRSGLLREPVDGAVDFVHRTFQDYLAARELVQERDFDLLARHAHEDQWDDVVRMAVAHARPDERARILRTLIERGDAEPEPRIRLYLLATACLEHATNLDPRVREEVELRAAAMFPPRSFDEAKALAGVGPVALELLPGPEMLEDDEAEAVAHAIAQFGSDAALARLAEFRDDSRPGVLSQLASHWDRFDTEAYGREIIAPLLSREDVPITVRSKEELGLLSRMGPPPRVYLHGDFTAEEISEALPEDAITELWLAGNRSVRDLDFLPRFRRLSELTLAAPEVPDLTRLADVPLHTLTLHMYETQILPSMPSLRKLLLQEPALLRIDELPVLESLESLSLENTDCELAGLSRFTGLTELDIVDLSSVPNDWAEIAELPRLSDLMVDSRMLELLDGGPALPTVRSIILLCVYETAPWLRLIPEHFPETESITLLNPWYGTDLTPLTRLHGLRNLHLRQPTPDVRESAQRTFGESVSVTVRPRPRP
ncbi:NACHT domain-containing protein [Streptomyces marispadix]|uniref:NACHT domain-containing protein n=1 Tax=Streptomyces marispadix TaxID=2922868 RepID=A0ABS9T070_9ACTN|nr:NACHT domain-containing protein [Streptomyces marispadix]MCH6161848.1 NACHT domain-containing protein [Streptomyces marispadix]